MYVDAMPAAPIAAIPQNAPLAIAIAIDFADAVADADADADAAIFVACSVASSAEAGDDVDRGAVGFSRAREIRAQERRRARIIHQADRIARHGELPLSARALV